MKLRQILKSEKGAVLPFVAIVLGLFALGFTALVVDVGVVYVERKAMVTSADAAALAGAQVLRESNGVNSTLAKTTAEEFAKANGADLSQIQVTVAPESVTLPSGETENRQVVDVTVGKNQSLFFARFLGDNDTDVKANAIATWGYVKKSYIGEFIPIFTFDTDYKLDTDIYLHEKITDTNNGYGYIDIGSGMGDIKKAIAGDNVGGTYIYDNYLDGKAGTGESLLGAIEDRMKVAQGKATPIERKNTMIGLVPVIDREEFFTISQNDSGNAANWKLPIKYFAYFEITDVIKQNQIVGSVEALNPSNEYKRRGTPAVDYSGVITTPSLLNNNGTGVENTLMIGRFTGGIVKAKTLVEAGDQINPNPGGDSPATYSKLIK